MVNLAKSLPLDLIARSPNGVIPGSRAFALTKKKTRLTLILDCRPNNMCDGSLGDPRLPHAALSCKMVLEPEEVVRLPLRDASNYYNLKGVPSERPPYQALGPPMSKPWWESGCPAWEPSPAFDATDFLELLLTGVIMRDRSEVPVGHEAHTRILLEGGLLEEGKSLIQGEPTPCGRLWARIYVDGLGLVQICFNKARHEYARLSDTDALERADATCDKMGLHESKEKKQRFFRQGVLREGPSNLTLN